MMQVKMKWNQGEKTVEVEESESEVYRKFGQILETIPIPNTVTLECPNGTAAYNIKERGTYIKDGVPHASMYVEEVFYCMHGLTPGDYKEAYLTCVNPESNNYKYYHLKPKDGKIHATYGRIGSERGEMFGTKDLKNPYPWHMYWVRYYEKLSKGYVDQSDIYLKKDRNVKKEKKEHSGVPAANKDSAYLFDILYSCARQVVRKQLKNAEVTREQVTKSKYFVNQMSQRKTVKGFNVQLLQLLAVCPRKARYVSELLAKTENDFPGIIQRERDLIAAMEALTMTSGKATHQSFESMGIEVYPATEQQIKTVMGKLSDTLKPKVKQIYRVINKKHATRFNEYLEENHIDTVKQLWHGSRTENWFSIIANGLQLNPDAVITGKMFGQGIYFAPSSTKSWNYTSCRGAGWTNGTSDSGFMGLYATAYGTPLNLTTSQNITQGYLHSQNRDCVHAHAGTHLKNDEIIFYSESAIVMNYIVEFQAD